MNTIGSEFPKEQARLRELIEEYTAMGLEGYPVAAMISKVLDDANRAAISGDTVAIVRSFSEMRGCQ